MRNFSIWQRQREIKGNLSLLPTTTYAPHQYGTTCQHVSVMPRGTRVALASLPVASDGAAAAGNSMYLARI